MIKRLLNLFIKVKSEVKMETILDLIKNRRTTRAYKKMMISEE